MIEKELKIRDICGDYALDIPFADGSVNTIYFNSKRNAETVKRIIEVDGSKPNEATVCDMQEIKHGSWEYDSEGVGYANYLCSECGNFLTFYEDIDLYPYCPYCGAKMDKEREKLKALRLENGLTQDELGEKLYLSRSSISSYEIGRNEPTIETIIAVSDLFNVTADELLR